MNIESRPDSSPKSHRSPGYLNLEIQNNKPKLVHLVNKYLSLKGTVPPLCGTVFFYFLFFFFSTVNRLQPFVRCALLYLKDIDSNDLLQDLKELQKENPKAKTQKLFDQAELGSDSEDEEDNQDTDWTRRLRPRTGKTVRFK